VEKKGLKVVAADTGELEQWCREAIAGNPKALADFKSGKDSAINGFKGAVMKAAKARPTRNRSTKRCVGCCWRRELALARRGAERNPARERTFPLFGRPAGGWVRQDV